MSKLLTVVIIITMFGMLPYRAEAQTLLPTDIPEEIRTEYPAYATALRLNPEKLSELRAIPEGELFNISLDVPILGTTEMTVERFNVLTHDVQMLTATSGGEVPFHVETPVFLSGEISEIPGSMVYMMLNSTSCEGIIEYVMPGDTHVQKLQFESIERPSDQMPMSVIIDHKDHPDYEPTGPITCGHDHSHSDADVPQDNPIENLNRKRNSDGILNWSMLEARIAIDCNWYFFDNSRQGNTPSSIQRTANRALFIIGGASAIYRRDVRVNLKLCYLRIWIEMPEVNTVPYRAIDPNGEDLCSGGGNAENCRYRCNMLPVVTQYWGTDMGHVEHTAVVWLNGLGCGGITYLNRLCSGAGSAAVNISAADYWNDSGDIGVFAHELGHNFHSPHANSYNPPIDNCTQMNPEPIGTLMNNTCSETASRFHARVKEVIRDAAENAACVYPDPSTNTTDFDASVEAILLPQAGATLYNGAATPPGLFAPFAPQATIRNICAQQMTNLQVDCAIIPFEGEWNDAVWVGSEMVTSLQSGASTVVTFTQPIPTADIPVAVNQYQVVIRLMAAQDQFAFNDQVIHHFTITDQEATSVVTVTSPNGNEQFYAGDVQTIQVDITNSNNPRVLIEYSHNNGVNWEHVAELPGSGTTTYNWTVPAIATSEALIRASILDNPAAPDVSNSTFTILLPHDLEVFDIVAPAGDNVSSPVIPRVEVRNNGNSRHENVPVFLEIKWANPENGLFGKTVFKELRVIDEIGPGATEEAVFTEAFMYHINQNPWDGNNQYFATATLLGTYDMTPANNVLERVFRLETIASEFEFITPRGNDFMQTGEEAQIQWRQVNGIAANWRLEWSNDGETWELIDVVASSGNSDVGTYLWTVENVPSENTMRLRVSNDQQPAISSVSEFFTVELLQPPIQLTSRQDNANGNPSIRLNWTASSSDLVTGYEVFRSVNGGTFNFLATINDALIEEYTDDNVQLCNDYRYRLRSYLDVNNQTILSVFTGQTGQKAVPTAYIPDPPTGFGHTGEEGAEPYGNTGSLSERLQFLIFEEELEAQGFNGNNDISGLAFDVFWAAHGRTLNNFRIRVRNIDQANMTTTFENNGFTTVFGPTDFTPKNGINQHEFSQLFNWDDSQDLLVDICWEILLQQGQTTAVPIPSQNHTEKHQSPDVNTFWSLRHADTGDDACSALTGVVSRFRPRVVVQANRSPLTLTSLNGGVVKIGQTVDVTWDAGCFNDVAINIDLSTDGGVSWDDELVENVPNTGEWQWTVPNLPTSSARIRISSVDDVNTNDISNSNFTIEAQNSTINISAPIASSDWQFGSTQLISWSVFDDPISTVDLHYSTDGGSSWDVVALGINNSGNYSWQVPSPQSSQARVRVRDSQNPGNAFALSQVFDITQVDAPSNLNVTPDNGALVMNLSWTAPQPTGIDGYKILRGNDINSIVTIDIIDNSVTYTDDNATPCVNYTYAVRAIVGPYNSANSASQSGLITPNGQQSLEVSSPNGGENLTIGTNWDITWNICNAPFNEARIEYSTDGGTNWIEIVDRVANNGSYQWTVPETPTLSGQVRVLNADNLFQSDVSDQVFSINPPNDLLIAAGWAHSLVIRPSSNSVWSWGSNLRSELGDGTVIDRNVPAEVFNLPDLEAIGAGVDHTIALTQDGRVFTWGANLAGQIGNGSTAYSVPVPYEVPSLGTITQVAAGTVNSYALRDDGRVWAWGDNGNGSIGDGTTVDRLSPVLIPGLFNVIQISAAHFTAYALLADGTVRAWGRNQNQLLGTGSLDPSVLVPEVMPNLANIVSVEAFGAAIASDGSVWGWGSNNFGEVGDGTTVNRTTPVPLPALSGAIQISRNQMHGIALKQNGEVWVWGGNGFGQLGDGTTVGKPQPFELTAVSSVQRVEAGGSFTMIYRLNGQVCTWGSNIHGQLGDGSNTDSSVPVCLSQSFLRSGEDKPVADLQVVNPNVNIYPNPNSGQSTLVISDAEAHTLQVIVSDALGRQVLNIERRNTTGELNLPLDLGNAARGLYLVKVIRDQKLSASTYVTIR